jgi:hypothetical protein
LVVQIIAIQPIAGHSHEGEWAGTLPELAVAREARNDSTGHPVRHRRTKARPGASFFIVQSSLNKNGFELYGHDEHGQTTHRYVDLPMIICGQLQALIGVLESAGIALDTDDQNHQEKFMDRPLTPILNALDYPLEKLGSHTGTDRMLVPGHAAEIRRGLEALQAAIQQRDEPFDEQWQYEYRKLHRALQVLEEYGRGTSDIDDDLADVCGWFVRYAIDDLRELTEEIDARYAAGE